MQNEVRSILNELDALCSKKDSEHVVESRAIHVITGAINLISYIQENYNPEVALELERRLLNSIRGKDTQKFSRAIKKIKEGKNERTNRII